LLIFLFFGLKKEKINSFFPFLGGFLLITGFYFYLNWGLNGSPFYSYKVNHFRVFHFSEGMASGFNRIFPSPEEFIKTNFPHFPPLVLNEIVRNLRALIDPAFLGPLIFGFFWLRLKNLKKLVPLLVMAMVTLIVFSLTWSAFPDPERHLSPVFIMLVLPLLTLFLEKPKLIFKGIFILAFAFYLILDLHRIDWARNQEAKLDFWNQKRREVLDNWFQKNSSESAIIASQNPWLVYLATQRPTILLPDNLFEKDNLTLFKNQYRAEYLVVEGPDPKIELRPIFSAEDFSIFKIN